MNVVCIINIKNEQNYYAKCLDCIKIIEGKNARVKHDTHLLDEAVKDMHIQIGYMQGDFAPRYLEEPMEKFNKGFKTNGSIQNRHFLTNGDKELLLNTENNIVYHIRIHLNAETRYDTYDDIIHLQYLAMLLMYLEPMLFAEKKVRKRLTVFVIPKTGREFPFEDGYGAIDYVTYDFISQYLRLLSKRYTGVIYGVTENRAGKPTVTSLNFRQSKQNRTFFPMLLIDKKKYDQLFVDSVNDILYDLFYLKRNGRFGNSINEDPNIAMRDYIAETDVKRIRCVVELTGTWERERNRILDFLISKGEMCLIHFSLFAFMLSDRGLAAGNDAYSYENTWQMALELSHGLRQIVQNALQHTQRQECFFTFYLHARGKKEEKEKFYQRIWKRFPGVVFTADGRDEALEIMVSDLNEQEDMIDTFVSNLQYELDKQCRDQQETLGMKGHRLLIEAKQCLAIRNFFAEYKEGDPISEWMQFRREDVIAHVGLGQFAQAAGKCSAAVKVSSSKNNVLNDERYYFYKSYASQADDSVRQVPVTKERHVIPGMQFAILAPIGALRNERQAGVSQLKQKKHVAENYKSFAAFLEYKEKRIDVSITENASVHDGNSSTILDSRKKYVLVQKWTEYWKKWFRKQFDKNVGGQDRGDVSKYVIHFDFVKALGIPYFTQYDRVEVCLRGIIGALDVFNELGEEYYLAMTNLPHGFIDSFRKICILLSIKDFPRKLQMCLQENHEKYQPIRRVIMLGDDFGQAIANAYVLSLEQGVSGFDRKDCDKAIALKKLLFSREDSLAYNKTDIVGAMPFDVILGCGGDGSNSLFERQLKEMSEGSLDEEAVGYKLNDTHMRLGSKVHIESFYEMSFLFYRTTIANRLAFMILRNLLDGGNGRHKIDLLNDAIMFYGYASYSKAILTSITEILQEYRREKQSGMEKYVAFASFQHNLMLESEETQMYFGLQDNGEFGRVDENNNLILNKKAKIVQIVPISSTLTTFEKMWKKFSAFVADEVKDKLLLAASYTIFWIVDKSGNIAEGMPSDIEKRYWDRVRGKTIETRFATLRNAGNSLVYFFRRSTVAWHDPLKCELCYPEYVISEVPLVETDPTSTVPTQQIRYKQPIFYKQMLVEDNFCERFRALEGCISYDHICRRHNHFQFYIDTQKYFYKVKREVRLWLQNLGNGLEGDTADPVLHIIFSPEHNTNVGFAQYVNIYYFKGLAEIVSINVDKQFRSNFVCEHAALKQMIEKLYRDHSFGEQCPVKFYFVDDTITTGETFQKANSLLQSLIPDNVYMPNVFSKIFLLIDRLSDDTKHTYVSNIDVNFISFLHIDISNTRTHGDSCIGCKLEQGAERMYKRSATRNMAHHWSMKIKDYQKKEYDDRSKIAIIDKTRSYRMMVFTHITKNIMLKQGHYNKIGDIYDVALNMSCWLLSDSVNQLGNAYGFEKLLIYNKGIYGIQAFFKTMCRPFLSYDFAIKRQLFTFFILLAEFFIGTDAEEIVPDKLRENRYISYLFENSGVRLENIKTLVRLIQDELKKEKMSRVEFLDNYILESLTDMGSTYIMRKQTLRKMYGYVHEDEAVLSLKEQEKFWNDYAVNVHRLVSGNADETKELWLEYLYMTGKEYWEFEKEYFQSEAETFKPVFLYTEITGNVQGKENDKFFYQFCHNLFLQNIGINFDNLEEKVAEPGNIIFQKDMFYKDYWRQIYCMTQFTNPFRSMEGQETYDTVNEETLFNFLKIQGNAVNGIGMKSVNEWYQSLLTYIVQVICNKYHVEDINIALLTETMNKEKNIAYIEAMDIVEEELNCCKIGISETKYCIKNRVVNALRSQDLFDLENTGYFLDEDIQEKEIQRPYVICFFDNPNAEDKKMSTERNIARVFLYISIASQKPSWKTQFILRLVLREIVTYRNRILYCLQKDFAGDLYARYARKNGEQNILSHEKAHSHNTTADDLITLEAFQDKEKFKSGYEKIDMEKAKDWLLLRNYTNGQIAKIFNRSFIDSQVEKRVGIDNPKLYIDYNVQTETHNPFKHPLRYFAELNLKNTFEGVWDRRMELLNEIVEFQYDKSLEKAAFVQGNDRQYYNREYFRCILIDMVISAIKFESTRADFLLRIDRFLEVKDLRNEFEAEAYSWMKEDQEMQKLYDQIREERCIVTLYRQESPYKGVDYLVVRNPVNTLIHQMDNWQKMNESIEHRLSDPLDFADGHMSLLAIKRYIENLNTNQSRRCVFRYMCEEKNGEDKQYFFENCLPILVKETI